MEIRHWTKDDGTEAVSRIYEESWKYAYKGIVPQSYMDARPAGTWAPLLGIPAVHTLVLVQDGKLTGTASVGASRLPAMQGWGELISIYFLPEYMGQGYGKQLLEAALQELHEMGFDDVYLWVLEENRRARRFYEKNGFAFSGETAQAKIGGKTLTELQYRRVREK